MRLVLGCLVGGLVGVHTERCSPGASKVTHRSVKLQPGHQTTGRRKRLSARLTQPWTSSRWMIIIGRIVATFFSRDVKSDHAPTASRDDHAVLVAKEVEAADLGTRDRLAGRFVVHLWRAPVVKVQSSLRGSLPPFVSALIAASASSLNGCMASLQS